MQPALAALAHELGLPTFGQTSAGDVAFERMSREPPQRYAGRRKSRSRCAERTTLCMGRTAALP
jgi:hypothetical protein